MRRCLVAIFALHFFFSVSAFAFSGAHSAAATQAPVVIALQNDIEVGGPVSQQGMTLAEPAMNHALVDQVPDLPDSLPRTLQVQRPPVDAAPSIGYRQRAALPPSLDGLLRPPQQAAYPA